MTKPKSKELKERSIDRTDRKILRLLQADGRISNKDLASKVNLSSTPCLRRVGLLEQSAVVQRYKAILDPERLGFTIRAFIHITRKREVSRESVWGEILAIPEVIACHVVSGDADLLVEVVARDTKHYSEILLDRINSIEGVYNLRSVFSLKPLKVDGDLPITAA